MSAHRAMILAVVITALAHGPSLLGTFVWDDNDTVLNRSCVGLPMWRLFIPHEFSRCAGELGYRPLVALSHRADLAVWGRRPFGHHLTNLMLHEGVVVLALCGLLRAGAGPLPALLGTLAFSVHPLTVEPVAGISYRTDILATLLMLGSAHLLFRSRPALSLGCYAAALCAKETAFLFPVVMAAWARGRYRGWLAIAAMLAIVVAGIRVGGARSDAEKALAMNSASNTLERAPVLLMRAFQLVIAPDGCPDRSSMRLAMTGSEAIRAWILAVAALAAVGWLLRIGQRRAGMLLLAALMFLGPYLGFYPLLMVLADRYLYTSLLLLACAGATLGSSLRRSPWSSIVAAMAGVVILLEAVVSVRAHQVWWIEETLFEHTARCAPDSRLAQYNYGRSLVNLGKYDAAQDHLLRAVELEPRYAKAWLALGVASLYDGNPDRALAAFVRAESLSGPSPELALNQAAAYLAADDTAGASEQIGRALTLQPGYAPALRALERLRGGLGVRS